MKLLTSVMSTIFGLLLLSVTAWLGFEIGKSEPRILIGVLPVLVFLSWIAFRLLDLIYRKIHPAVYRSRWGERESGPGFTIFQAIISSLRSAVLCLAVPGVSLALLFMFLVPLLLAAGDVESSLGFAAVAMLMVGVLGWVIQWRYRSGVLRLMQAESATSSNERDYQKKASVKAGKRQVRVLDAAQKIRLSKRAAEKQRAATRLRRLAGLRVLIGPIAALAGMIAVAWFFQLESISYQRAIGLMVVWGILLVLAWAGSTLRLADRTPLRQLRLGFGFLIHALLVAFSAPFMLLFELPGKQGLPAKQWTIVPKLGRWASKLLRSPRLVWFPAILFASMALTEVTENLDKDTLFMTIASFAAGIISFELIYFLFRLLIKRQPELSNRLVFLRVFGDARRGAFLFRQVVPRWKGLGSIVCIAAPDVSLHQLEADIGFDLLFGRLRQRFLTQEEASTFGRHISSDALGAVWEDHCFDDTWMPAVKSLITQNAIVMMDLRGFGPERKGCLYELGVLRDYINIESVVFLIDSTTDFKFLKSTLDQLWENIASDSPNTHEGGPGAGKHHPITIFRMSASKRESAKQLVRLLIEACVANEVYHQKNGQLFLKQLIDDLQLLAADVAVQVKAVGGGRWPGKKVLEAGYSCDHDLGSTNYLSTWGLITDQQYEAIYDVNDAVQEIRCGGPKHTAAAMKDDPAWQELRVAARNCLKVLGKRRTPPKPLAR